MASKGYWGKRLLGTLLLIETAAAIYVLFAIWGTVASIPSVSTGTTAAVTGSAAKATTNQNLGTVMLFGYHWLRPSADSLYFVAVMVLGALGSSVHAFTSFARYLGRAEFTTSWTAYYLVRLPVGIVLALIFYFVVRGGLLSISTSTGSISPYGIGAIAALAGMFSEQVVTKLKQLMDTLKGPNIGMHPVAGGDRVA